MGIPTSSNYPVSLDSDTTLFGTPVDQVTLTLTTGITGSDTSFTVDEAITSINVPVFLVFETGEIVYAEGKVDGTKTFNTVTRGSVPASHNAGENIRLALVSHHLAQLKRAIVAIETELGAAPSGTYDTVDARMDAFAGHDHDGVDAPNIPPANVSPQGSTSTLDADLLDGQHGSYYLRSGRLIGTAGSLLTISSGSVTATPGSGNAYHVIAAESGTADDLVTISGGSAGDILIIKPDTGDTITLKEGGNIALPRDRDYVIPSDVGTFLRYDGSNWYVLGLKMDTRVFVWRLTPHDVAPTTGDDKGRWEVPAEFDGWTLTDIEAQVDTAPTAGTTTLQLYSIGDTADVLSTAITIDTNETSSRTAATPPVINATYAPLTAGDRFRADFDAIGTSLKGVTYVLTLRGYV